jgi:hypothetical protein
MEQYSISLAMKEMKIKTILRFHLIPIRLAIIKKTNNNKCWQGCGGKGTSYPAGGNVNYYNHCGNQYGGASENYLMTLYTTLRHTSKGM